MRDGKSPRNKAIAGERLLYLGCNQASSGGKWGKRLDMGRDRDWDNSSNRIGPVGTMMLKKGRVSML